MQWYPMSSSAFLFSALAPLQATTQMAEMVDSLRPLLAGSKPLMEGEVFPRSFAYCLLLRGRLPFFQSMLSNILLPDDYYRSWCIIIYASLPKWLHGLMNKNDHWM